VRPRERRCGRAGAHSRKNLLSRINGPPWAGLKSVFTARGRRRHRNQVGNYSFRATGITAYLRNGGTLEKAAAMANHASTRTTQLYDRRRVVSLDEVERIAI
jgi:hypothetical protein